VVLCRKSAHADRRYADGNAPPSVWPSRGCGCLFVSSTASVASHVTASRHGESVLGFRTLRRSRGPQMWPNRSRFRFHFSRGQEGNLASPPLSPSDTTGRLVP